MSTEMIRTEAETGGFTAHLVDPTRTLLDEIALAESTRRDIAMTYHLAMKSCHATDWGQVNRTIMERWSESGLIWIKTQAASGACFLDKKAKVDA